MAVLALNDRLKEAAVAAEGQTVFPADFPCLAAADIRVDRRRGAEIETLFPGVDFEVINDDGEDFSIELAGGATAGDVLTIYSLTLPQRDRQHIGSGPPDTGTLEDDAMQFEAQAQEAVRDLARTIRFPMGETGPVMPPRVGRQSKVLTTDANGEFVLEDRGNFAAGEGEPPAPGGGVGNGLVRYAFNPDEPARSLAHVLQPGLMQIRDVVASAFCTAAQTANSGGRWELLDESAGDPAMPAYGGALAGDNPAFERIYIQTEAGKLGLLDDAYLDLAQLGLRADDTINTLGQEAIFMMARDYVLSHHDDDIQQVIDRPIIARGNCWTDVGEIDMKMCTWLAGSAFKVFAKNGLKDGDGNALPRSIIKFGRGTSPQNRFSIRRDLDVYVEGNQNSNLNDANTRVIGVTLYDEVGTGGLNRVVANRCYTGLRLKGNTEKQRIYTGHAYCSVALESSQARIKMSHYVQQCVAAAKTPRADLEDWLLLEDYGTAGKQAEAAWPSGYLGEWNPTLNQQNLSDVSAAGKVGIYYKVTQSGNCIDPATSLARTLNGRLHFDSGKWLVWDGAYWWQVDDTDDTPDTNEIDVVGQNNEVLVATSYNADSSAVVRLLHESRQYKGGTIQVYRDLVESLVVPTPAIIDRGGKLFKWIGHARAGDSMLFGLTGKTKGTDTTVFDLTDNHVYGTMWWFEDAAKIEGSQLWTDCANGRKPNPANPAQILTDFAVPVVRINKVRDAGGFRLTITKATNGRKTVAPFDQVLGDDGFQTAAVIIGDQVRKKGPVDLNLPHVAVSMGNPQTIPTADPPANSYIALQVRWAQNLNIISPELMGQLDYWADAKKVHHTVPASFVRGRYTVNAAAGSSVTIRVDGDVTATEAFAIAWPARVKIVAVVDGVPMSRINGKWRPMGTARVKLVDITCRNSNLNRYMETGTLVTCEDDDELYWLKANAKWRKIDGTETAPSIMAQTQYVLDRYTAKGLAAPALADIDKLDRAIYRMVRGAYFAKGRLGLPLRMVTSRQHAGVNIFAANVSDPAGHPYDVTPAAANWTAGRGFKPDVTTARLGTGFNPSGAVVGGWDPKENCVDTGDFLGAIFASAYEHTVENTYDFAADNGKAGVRLRAQSGATSRMNATTKFSFSTLTSDMPHLLGALRNGHNAADHYNLDNGQVDRQSSDDPAYAADYNANKGLPTQFYIAGGNTNDDGSLRATLDRTVGGVFVFDKTFTLADAADFADVEREWGQSDGFYP